MKHPEDSVAQRKDAKIDRLLSEYAMAYKG
jgi:hypothetical protein